MAADVQKLLASRLDRPNLKKLLALANPKLHRFVAEAIELCQPASVFVCTDAARDIAYVRQQAIERGEEQPLAIPGHTVHFDGLHDQGRDKEVTKYMLPPGQDLGENINSIDKQQGLEEIRGLMRGIMKGREMLVRFFCLGPVASPFAISGVQLTDSYYVGHSEDLLYRPGYEQFKRLADRPDFFRVLHSAGELKDHVSAHPDKKRIYIDLEEGIVYSVNTQYAGNTVGFKKLSLRLAIHKADREGWLAEHMFIMGVHGPGGRVTYFAGAFPSFCGKTSTSMIPHETIVGDDLAYLRKMDGLVRAANVECGIFGIIKSLNATDDPILWEVLTTPGEVIFSNVLVADGVPYWTDSGVEPPECGVNYQGLWRRGITDAQGKEVPWSHPNARYTVRLSALRNLDPRADDPAGVPLGAIIYGGRDADTWVPVQQSFDWAHGVVTMGASLESETTAATLGQTGLRAFQPMANLDFVSIPLGRYIRNHLEFVRDVARPPLIFSVNYFLRGPEGQYLTGMKDKYVWVKWMERRVHGEVGAIRTPTGYIPVYEDLVRLFAEVLGQPYAREDYEEQFTLRIPENLAKIDRMEAMYRTKVADTPPLVFQIFTQQRQRLLDAQARLGNYIAPSRFAAQ